MLLQWTYYFVHFIILKLALRANIKMIWLPCTSKKWKMFFKNNKAPQTSAPAQSC